MFSINSVLWVVIFGAVFKLFVLVHFFELLSEFPFQAYLFFIFGLLAVESEESLVFGQLIFKEHKCFIIIG